MWHWTYFQESNVLGICNSCLLVWGNFCSLVREGVCNWCFILFKLWLSWLCGMGVGIIWYGIGWGGVMSSDRFGVVAVRYVCMLGCGKVIWFVRCCVCIVLISGSLCCWLGKRVLCIRVRLLCSVCMWVIFRDGAMFGLVVVVCGKVGGYGWDCVDIKPLG
jgi:hypothetical protein